LAKDLEAVVVAQLVDSSSDIGKMLTTTLIVSWKKKSRN